MEIELKYKLNEASDADAIFDDVRILDMADAGSEKHIKMHAVYFDTKDGNLSSKGMVFRAREEGEKLMATLKWDGVSIDGLHVREEINVPLNDRVYLQKPDIKVFSESDIFEELESIVDGKELVLMMEMNFVRRAVRLDNGVGISSGANFIGALMLQNKLGKDSIIVTVFPDDNKKYLSTDLMKSEKVKEDFSSLKENDNDFQEKISTDEDERNKKINKNFEDALDLHLNAETDEEFQKAEEDFSSFIKTYKDFPDKPPALENLLTEASSYLVASKFRVKRLVGYLTFADILGWKGIWQKQNTDVGKIDNIRKLLSIKDNLNKKFLNDESFHNVKLISDTFVIYSRSFELSNKLSKELIKLCLEKELLIRGATSYGECYNKDMVYIGQAVDEAASWHEKGEEIGIFYTSSARLSKNLNDDELEKYYLKNNEVNTKHGKIKTYFINWYNETTEKKFYEIMKKEIIYPEISLKYFNTENRLKKILHPEKKEKK